MTMMNEQEYLKLYPERHKMNFHLNSDIGGCFCQLVAVNGKKITIPNLSKCIKFKDSEIELESETRVVTINQESWEVVLIKNIDYVKDNAIVSIHRTLNSKTKSGYFDYGVVIGYIDESGLWKGYTPKSDVEASTMCPHKIDNGLMDALPQMFEENSTVVDFGCGNADYVKHLHNNGFKVEAYDGNPNTPEMTDSLGKVLDLSKEFDLGKTFDYVVSLEVAEHIPKKFQDVYVNNLIKHTDSYLIISWALDGQGGDGHVNEQNEDYVLNLFDKLGMTYHQDISQILRDVAKLGWFKKTIYVFTKKNN
jgi:2-polyprenyl-3-methyl-5-hydroxy-6-metoxy-1,4-benzoquinol methylase|tara:strand:- start:1518 stop:2438 length:921 start_codon:yes stop_codon:yes gene_type:complete